MYCHLKMKLMIFLLLLLFNLTYAEINFDLFAKSLKFTYTKDIARDVKCGFKPTRKFPGGIGNCRGYLLQNITGGYVQLALFYKYGQIFRNYLINYPKLEPCEILKKQRSVEYSNPLADIVLRAWKKCCPLIYHECPFIPGWYAAVNVNINATVVPYLPPVVPAGIYKLYLRYYDENNTTKTEVEMTGVVKPNFANRNKDFSMLNMGR